MPQQLHSHHSTYHILAVGNCIMGTAPPSKPVPNPARPFDRSPRRSSCLAGAFLPTAKKTNILFQLIACRDWQKVLIRAALFPSEIDQPQKMTWYGLEWKLLPLHLACALQPPGQVIAMLLHYSTDAAQIPMVRCNHPKGRAKWSKRRRLPLRGRHARNQVFDFHDEHDAFPMQHSNYIVPSSPVTSPRGSSDDESGAVQDMIHNEDATLRAGITNDALEEPIPSMIHSSYSFDEDDQSAFYSLENSIGDAPDSVRKAEPSDYHKDNPADAASKASETSLNLYLGREGLALQLGPSGCVSPISVITHQETVIPQDHLDTPPPSRMKWNFDPLLKEADEFLPLHVASLYQASPEVLELLLQAHPTAARVSTPSWGMLPIHMMCAGFTLPPPIAQPPPVIPGIVPEEWKLVESLRCLAEAFPESLETPSENNGMTPEDYVEETMEEGAYKQQCLTVLQTAQSRESEEAQVRDQPEPVGAVPQLASSVKSTDSDSSGSFISRSPDEVSILESIRLVPSEIHCDGSTIPSLRSEVDHLDLSHLVSELKGHSRLHKHLTNKNWKRALRLVEDCPEQARHWQYGIEMDAFNDPQLWKRLPLHHAFVLRAPLGLIEALIMAYPQGATLIDPYTGSLALHLACLYNGPLDLLLEAYPQGAQWADGLGRLPLHLACGVGASARSLQLLLEAYPDAVHTLDAHNMTPLDYAKDSAGYVTDELEEFRETIQRMLEASKIVGEADPCAETREPVVED